ncbi:MAG: right-handed parallel beta-helix repeat-containing protein [Clostridia bacterium]|nr:right-handed parallel beta-helix repeat-containing protein [Clostridia bacterium]MBQ9749074.1 right-handed parallel beta-helix repeat-containing protein [Clostridia bacterium]
MLNSDNASILYVSGKRGDDLSSGITPDTAFKTLGRALDEIKKIRKNGYYRPMTITLTDDLFITSPITIDEQDVTVTSFRGRKSILGGFKIEGWCESSFNGHKCLSARLPECGTPYDFTDLYVNGKYASSPRYPKDGTLRVLAVENESVNQFEPSKYFIAKKEDLEHIENIEDATVNYFHMWIDEHTPVESYDRESGKLVMAYSSRFCLNTIYEPHENSNALKYYLTNVPNTFGAPGEWYLDRKSSTVYYVPTDPSENAESIVAYAPVSPSLFTVKADNVRFIDLKLACTRCEYVSRIKKCTETDSSKASPDCAYGSDGQSVCGSPGAIIFDRCKFSSVKNCEITNVGIYALEVRPGCKKITVEGCEIHEIAAGGIKISGGITDAPAEDATTDCVIRKNHIHHCGIRYPAGCGVLVCNSSSNEISENEISYLEYTGISVGWVWGYAESRTFGNLITKNHIHHIGMGRLSDMGGIYTLGKQHGTVISENRIHDVKSAHYGGWGIYTDEGSSYITIENNVVYNTKCGNFHQHYGSNNVIRNNIFAFAGTGAVELARAEEHESFSFENNIVLVDSIPIYSPVPYMVKNGETINDPEELPNVSRRNNILWNISGPAKMYKGADLKKWQSELHQDLGSIECDPLFVDAKNFDFRLKEDSIALDLGFNALTGFLASGKKDL